MTTSDDGSPPLDPVRPDPAAPAGADHETVVLAPAGPRRHAREAERPRRTTPTPLGRVLLPLGLALVSAVALVAGWGHLQDDRAAGSAAPVVSSSASAAPTPSASGTTAAPSPTPSRPAPTVSATPSRTATASPSSAPVPTGVASPSSSASATVDRSVPVVVLNSTSRTGLAAKVAASLRRDGWRVVRVGNYRGGRLAVTTVYADGHPDAVATMADDLSGASRATSPTGSMSRSRLTVVIGADYPRG